jgi:hypothetical protein
MTGPKHQLRTPGIVLGILAVIISAVGASVAVGYAASSKSNTIKACVAKSSKNIYQANKCKKGDKKLTWSVTGPAGAQGPAGNPGANGAVAGVSVVQGAPKDITGNSGFTTVISKQLPAGSYIFTAKAQADANNDDNTVAADSTCRLTDGTNTDDSQIVGPIITVPFAHVNDSVHTMTLATTKAAAFTISLQCKNGLTSPPANYGLTITNAKISGVQTTSNS